MLSRCYLSNVMKLWLLFCLFESAPSSLMCSTEINCTSTLGLLLAWRPEVEMLTSRVTLTVTHTSANTVGLASTEGN